MDSGDLGRPAKLHTFTQGLRPTRRNSSITTYVSNGCFLECNVPSKWKRAKDIAGQSVLCHVSTKDLKTSR